jgi:hypothetical protein
MPKIDFIPEENEAIYYHSQPGAHWLGLAWKGLGGLLLVLLFGFYSISAFAPITHKVLSLLMGSSVALILSDVLCMGLLPLLVLLWFVEDTLQSSTTELVLTDRRIWMKNTPNLWSPVRELPLSDIRFIRDRRGAIFIYTISGRKPQVHMFPDSKQIAKTYQQLTGNTGR